MTNLVELRRKLKKRTLQKFLAIRVKKLHHTGEMVKLVIGAGRTNFKEWLMTDLPTLDALKLADWQAIFSYGTIDRILAEHVVEHWTVDQICDFLKIVNPFLSEQGFIRIAVPDGFHPDPAYIKRVEPGGIGKGAEDHKILYNYRTLGQLLSARLYDYKFLEYFDEMGRFHQEAWEATDGFIRRSARHDPRNKEASLSYTSLIVDAWPRR